MPLKIKLSLHCHQNLMSHPFNAIPFNSAVSITTKALSPQGTVLVAPRRPHPTPPYMARRPLPAALPLAAGHSPPPSRAPPWTPPATPSAARWMAVADGGRRRRMEEGARERARRARNTASTGTASAAGGRPRRARPRARARRRGRRRASMASSGEASTSTSRRRRRDEAPASKSTAAASAGPAATSMEAARHRRGRAKEAARPGARQDGGAGRGEEGGLPAPEGKSGRASRRWCRATQPQNPGEDRRAAPGPCRARRMALSPTRAAASCLPMA